MEKVLHIDQDGKKVIEIPEFDDTGCLRKSIVMYEDSKIKHYTWLSPFDAACLTILGTEIKQSYIPHISPEYFEKAWKSLRSKNIRDIIIARLKRIYYHTNEDKKNWQANLKKIESKIEIKAKTEEQFEPSGNRLDTSVKSYLRFDRKSKIAMNFHLTYQECIIGKINLSKSNINGYVWFSSGFPLKSSFGQTENFPSTEYEQKVEPTYIFDLKFSEAEIQGDVSFCNCHVLKENRKKKKNAASFKGTKIKKHFKIRHSFWMTSLECNPIEIGKKFDAQKSKFYKIANFEGMKVGEEVSFKSVEFAEDAHFENATFKGRVDFSDVKPDAKDEKDVTNEAHFRGKANFTGVVFKDNANFSKVVFHDIANFRGVQFEDHAWFKYVKFAKRANFSSATFNRNAIFHGPKNPDKIPEMNMHRTRVREAADFRKRKFLNLDLSQTAFSEPLQFHDSTFKNVDFRDIVAPEIRVKFEALQPDKNGEPKITPHRVLTGHEQDAEPYTGEEEEWDDKRVWQETQRQYAMLKENFRQLGQYDDEDNAHWWASECARMATPVIIDSNKAFKLVIFEIAALVLWIIAWYFSVNDYWCPLAVLSAFFMVCVSFPRLGIWLIFRKALGYGVKPQNLLIPILIVVLICFVAYAYSYDSLYVKHPPTNSPIFNAFYFSLITFATVGYGDMSPQGWLAGLATIEGILGVILNAALIIVISRKLIR